MANQSTSPSDRPHGARQRLVVDKEFQFQYVRICFWSGLAVIGVAVLIYAALRMFGDVNPEVQPNILRVLIGIIVFIVVFCIAIGLITVRMTHKVAGAAFGLERSIARLREGRLDDPVQVRQGDYLKNIAASLDDMRNDMVYRLKQLESLEGDLIRIRESVPAGAGLAADEALERVRALKHPRPVSKKS